MNYSVAWRRRGAIIVAATMAVVFRYEVMPSAHRGAPIRPMDRQIQSAPIKGSHGNVP